MNFFEKTILVDDILHRYVFDPSKVIELYGTDDHPATYVCTTAMPTHGSNIVRIDVYYQPNKPGYSNNYFGIFWGGEDVRICGADDVELLQFALIDDDTLGLKIYSRDRHDFVRTSDRVFFIDGGRTYTRTNTLSMPYVVRNGKMIPATWVEEK